jgi:pSer/pThr/pTyr-binding forkhead associated (FHA) protein
MKRFWRSSTRNAARPPAADEATRVVSSTPSLDEDRFLLSLPGGKRQEFTLSKANIAIGRATANDVVLADPSVSRRHARVERSVQGCEIIDLGSANGVTVNGIKVARYTLKPGDVFGIGDSSLRFVRGQERSPDMTRIDSEQDLESTLIETPLPMNLEETALARVVVLTPDRTWEVPMQGDNLTIGCGSDNAIVIDSESVSRHHAVIERRAASFVIRDLRSKNGTWVGNQRVSERVVDDGDSMRIGAARLMFKRGFATDELTNFSDRVAKPRRRPVVIVPGFAGSTLWSGSEKIWPTRGALLHPDMMRLDNPLEARGLVDEVVIVPNLIKQDRYSPLTNHLKENLHYETGKDLLEFGYDFRQDNRKSAAQLAEAIDGWNVVGPITIIAHSMGSLVTRYYLECLGGKSKVERAIFLGGPHVGTPYAFTTLLKGPDLLPLGLMNTRLRDLLASFPSWYQILPTYQFASDQRSGFDVLTDESWLDEKSRPLLRNARMFRAGLGVGCSVPSVCVFGYDIRTITSVAVEREDHGTCRKASFVVTRRGDGMIPEISSLLKGSEIHPVHQHHAALHSDNDVKMRLTLELTREMP